MVTSVKDAALLGTSRVEETVIRRASMTEDFTESNFWNDLNDFDRENSLALFVTEGGPWMIVENGPAKADECVIAFAVLSSFGIDSAGSASPTKKPSKKKKRDSDPDAKGVLTL